MPLSPPTPSHTGDFASLQVAGLRTVVGHMRWGWPGLGQKQKRIPGQNGGCVGLLGMAPGLQLYQRLKLTHHLHPPGEHTPSQPCLTRSFRNPRGCLHPCTCHIHSCWTPGPRSRSQICFPSNSWHLVLWPLTLLVCLFTYCLHFYFSLSSHLVNSCLW